MILPKGTETGTKKHARGLKITACVPGGLLLVYEVLTLFPRPDIFTGRNPMRRDGELPIRKADFGYTYRLQDVYDVYTTEQ